MLRKNNVLYTTIVLSVICAGVALLLATVHQITKPVIETAIMKEKETAISQLIPGFLSFEVYKPTLTDADELYIVKSENQTDYCIIVTPTGFGGDIELMVAITPELKVSGIKVLAHTETAGVGTKIQNENFLNSFVGVKMDTLKDGVDVISGATVSSTAVKKGVSVALEAVENYIRENTQG